MNVVLWQLFTSLFYYLKKQKNIYLFCVLASMSNLHQPIDYCKIYWNLVQYFYARIWFDCFCFRIFHFYCSHVCCLLSRHTRFFSTYYSCFLCLPIFYERNLMQNLYNNKPSSSVIIIIRTQISSSFHGTANIKLITLVYFFIFQKYFLCVSYFQVSVFISMQYYF